MVITDIEKTNIYRDYYGKICGYILAKTNNKHTAEDITSEVFLKVFEKLNTFDESKSSLSTWIYTVTRNTLTDYFRTKKVFEVLPEDIAEDSYVEDEICNTETLEELAQALEKLDNRERDIIILHYYSGKTLKEISEKLGISYAYVKVLQSKALKNSENYLKTSSFFLDSFV